MITILASKCMWPSVVVGSLRINVIFMCCRVHLEDFVPTAHHYFPWVSLLANVACKVTLDKL